MNQQTSPKDLPIEERKEITFWLRGSGSKALDEGNYSIAIDLLKDAAEVCPSRIDRWEIQIDLLTAKFLNWLEGLKGGDRP